MRPQRHVVRPRLLNIAFTSGYKEGGVALLRAVDGDHFFVVIFILFIFLKNSKVEPGEGKWLV